MRPAHNGKEMKTCPRCNRSLDRSAFGKNRSKTDGLQSHCKTCRRSINNEHYAKSDRRKETVRRNSSRYYDEIKQYIKEYKSLHGCLVCGEKESCCIDFHHTDSNKEKDVSRLKNTSLSKVKEEIGKCITLCSNCHRKLHAGLIEI